MAGGRGHLLRHVPEPGFVAVRSSSAPLALASSPCSLSSLREAALGRTGLHVPALSGSLLEAPCSVQAALPAKAPLSVAVPAPLPTLPGPPAGPARQRRPCPAPRSFAIARLGLGATSGSLLHRQRGTSRRVPVGRRRVRFSWFKGRIRPVWDSCAFSAHLDSECDAVLLFGRRAPRGSLLDIRKPSICHPRSCNDLGLHRDLSDALTVSATSSSQSCGRFEDAAPLAEPG